MFVRVWGWGFVLGFRVRAFKPTSEQKQKNLISSAMVRLAPTPATQTLMHTTRCRVHDTFVRYHCVAACWCPRPKCNSVAYALPLHYIQPQICMQQVANSMQQTNSRYCHHLVMVTRVYDM